MMTKPQVRYYDDDIILFDSYKCNFQLFWFCFTQPFDWSRKLAPSFQPIRLKTVNYSRLGRARLFRALHNVFVTFSFPINGSSDYFHLCSVRYTRADQNQLRYETLKRQPMKNENYSLSAFYFRYHPRLILRGQKSQHKIPGTFNIATLTFSYFRGAFICLIIGVHLSRKISLSCVLLRVNNFDEFCFVSPTKVLLVLTVVRMNCMVEILIPC